MASNCVRKLLSQRFLTFLKSSFRVRKIRYNFPTKKTVMNLYTDSNKDSISGSIKELMCAAVRKQIEHLDLTDFLKDLE